jgi:hypothetical protein
MNPGDEGFPYEKPAYGQLAYGKYVEDMELEIKRLKSELRRVKKAIRLVLAPCGYGAVAWDALRDALKPRKAKR